MEFIFKKHKGSTLIESFQKKAWRIVESQETTATRKLVDNYHEQIILEDLLENIKPTLTSSLTQYHPLIYTPFRYPPLPYGSRFGNKTQPSLWYGSLKLNTAFSEKAYYQFNFLRGTEAIFDFIKIPLTAFAAEIKTSHGIDLTKPPFNTHQKKISSPNSYKVSQQLGDEMRQANIQAFIYHSARDLHQGSNIAAFSINAFKQKSPIENSFQSWVCMGDIKSLEFSRVSILKEERLHFNVNSFYIDGTLPFPAS